MNEKGSLTDEAFLIQLGARLAQLRLSKNLTQQQLAEQAGLGVRTVQRLELGAAATQLSGFVRICRVLGLMDRLAGLVPEQTASPMELLKLQSRRRQRASGKTRSAAKTNAKAWTWGEPQ